MTLTEIHDMAADALAGEQLQFLQGYKWCTDHEHCSFHPSYTWRIKPTIEVNGVLMSKREAKAAWEASGATGYEFRVIGGWLKGDKPTPTLDARKQYRWTKTKWIYVNGVAIVPEGGSANYGGHWVANEADGLKLMAAINALVEVK